MDWVDVLIVCIKSLVVFVFLLLSLAVLVWAERKLLADMQTRIGPNRAGPYGILQTVADAVKLLTKENITPRESDRSIYWLAPLLSAVPAFLSISVVPFGDSFTIGDRTITMQLTDLNIGILLVLAMSSIGVYGVMLAGWSSGSKYPLVGSVRASAQMISYEAAMGLSIVTVVIWAGTLSMRGIVEAQATWRWFIFLLPSFVIYVMAGIAETNRAPFDLVEAESELVGGYHTEYSGARFLLFFLAEYLNMVTISAIAVTLFLGGPNGPHISFLPALWPFVWFFLKLMVFLFLYIWLRATLPRLRYDQLMTLGWKVLIPVNLVWLMIVSLVVALQERGVFPQVLR